MLLFAQSAFTQYLNDNKLSQISYVSIPINISQAELTKTINHQIPNVVYDDNDMSDDGMTVRAKIIDDVSIQIENELVRYAVPLSLKIKKDIGISNVNAGGEISLDFVTKYVLSDDWNVTTETTLEGYDWIQKPVVKLGIVKLSIKSIANSILKNTTPVITKAIDEQAAQALDLRGSITSLWYEMQKSQLLYEDYDAYLQINPQQIDMLPLNFEDNRIKSAINIKCKPKVTMGFGAPYEERTDLPDINWIDTECNDFSINLNTVMDFDLMQKIALDNIKGMDFEVGKRKVRVEDLAIEKLGNKLKVVPTLSGAYDGKITFIGQPKYNKRKKEIELEDVKIDFTKNKVVFKGIVFFFKKKIRKMVQDMINEQLNIVLKDTEQLLQSQLANYEVAQGVTIDGKLNALQIQDIFIGNEGIHLDVETDGILSCEIKF